MHPASLSRAQWKTLPTTAAAAAFQSGVDKTAAWTMDG